MSRIVLVNPPSPKSSPFAAIEPPFWCGLMADYFRRQGKEVIILDADRQPLTVDETLAELDALKPQQVILVAMGNNPSASSTPKMPVVTELATRLREEVKTQITGLHPMALPRQTYRETGCEVLEWHPTPDLMVDWDMIPPTGYRAHNWHCLSDIENRTPYAVLYTSLGCPHSCHYCNVHTAYGGRRVQYREEQDVLEELDVLVNRYGVKNIKIWDELFTLDYNRVEHLCNEITHAFPGLNFWAYSRVGSMPLNTLGALYRAGFHWLCYGFESLAKSVRDGVSKHHTDDQVFDYIWRTHDNGIDIMANFVFGLPDDTLETMQQTLTEAEKYNFSFVNFYTAMPYPGSELYFKLRASQDWSSYNQFSPNPAVMDTKYLKAKEIVSFRDYAFQHYFSRPEYQNKIKDRYGDKALEHIQDMLKWSVARGKVEPVKV